MSSGVPVFLLDPRRGLSKKLQSVNQATGLSRWEACWMFLMESFFLQTEAEEFPCLEVIESVALHIHIWMV